jgi:hypothetical protein
MLVAVDAGVVASSGAAQEGQKRLPSGASVEHAGQRKMAQS